ncbi:putative T7SS-secreted protein [Streptomyces thinghirensis]|uniref:Putative T7SS secretion signal domain-containing protein n=1 Tax=Streptomyces thinghirensis TaxID=551547 RepID=A0ABP9T857_9ACTN
MSAPTLDDFPALGFVPCPGDHIAVDKVSDSIRHTAEALGEIKKVLDGAAKGDWRGKAAIAFRELLDDDFRPKVVDAYDSFDKAKGVIQGWSSYMEDKQKKARSLEREAAEAKSAADKSKDKGGSEAEKKPSPGSADETDPVEDVRKRARTLHSDYEEEGRNAAKRLQKAIDIAPNEPGFWDKLGEAIANALDSIADAAAWLHDQAIELLGKLAPLLDLIGDIAGLLSAVTGLLALVPGLQFLGAASLVLAGVALGAHYLSAVGTTGSFGKALLTKDVIMDAVGFGLGKVGAKIGEGVLAAAKASGAPTRMVPQLIGPAQELPMGYFQLASTSYAMGHTEFLWRTGGYFTTWTGNVMTAEGSGDSVETLGKIFSWDFGPLTQKPKVSN